MALVAIVPIFGCADGTAMPSAAPVPPTFGQPENLRPTINSSDFDGGPSISADGLELFFDRAPEGHIFVITRASTSVSFRTAMPLSLRNEVCRHRFPAI